MTIIWNIVSIILSTSVVVLATYLLVIARRCVKVGAKLEPRFVAKRSAILLVLIIALAIFRSADEPVAGDAQEMQQFILSQYKQQGVYYTNYLAYDESIDQYRYCCFDDDGSIIGLTASTGSEFVTTTEEYMPYHVDIYSYTIKSRLTGRVLTHVAHQVFYLPDDAYAVVNINDITTTTN